MEESRKRADRELCGRLFFLYNFFRERGEENEELGRADIFAKLSGEEMRHVDKLHAKVSELISRYRQTQGEPTAGMLAIYDYLHEQQIENAMRVKVKQRMYEEAA